MGSSHPFLFNEYNIEFTKSVNGHWKSGEAWGGFRRKPKLHCEGEFFRASSSMGNWTCFEGTAWTSYSTVYDIHLPLCSITLCRKYFRRTLLFYFKPFQSLMHLTQHYILWWIQPHMLMVHVTHYNIFLLHIIQIAGYYNWVVIKFIPWSHFQSYKTNIAKSSKSNI